MSDRTATPGGGRSGREGERLDDDLHRLAVGRGGPVEQPQVQSDALVAGRRHIRAGVAVRPDGVANGILVKNTVVAPVSKVSISSDDGPMIVTIYTFDPVEAKAHEAGISKLVQSTLGTPVTIKFVSEEK